MRRYLCFLLLAFSLASTSAQTSHEGVTRQQIQEGRSAEEARFSDQERACYERFAVNDCLKQVRLKRRLVLEDLRRQEVFLNDLERRKKGADQLELIQEKSSPQKFEELNASRLEAVKAQKEREASAAKKRADQLHPPWLNKDDKRAKPPLESSRSAQEAAKNKMDFELKLKEAQEHRQSREAELLKKKTDKPVQPLPLQ
jgi:colicin import membrane protein